MASKLRGPTCIRDESIQLIQNGTTTFFLRVCGLWSFISALFKRFFFFFQRGKEISFVRNTEFIHNERDQYQDHLFVSFRKR